jgi:signal transduction histidine kinase
MLQQNKELIAIIIAGTIMLLLLGIFIVGFLFFYQKKQNAHITEQELLKATFSQELLKTQIEVQEQTLAHISREIHDNITQVLSFIKLNLAITGKISAQQKDAKLSESRVLVAQVITDLRDLSKSLSFEHIRQLGLLKTMELEAERINKSGIIKVLIKDKGDIYSLGEERELVLFRIFQEALNNALKHSDAKTLKISLHYFKEIFNLTIEDNGVGFSAEQPPNGGSGLKNIVNRAALIGAIAKIDAAPGKGCCIKIAINPFTQNKYADGSQNSPG